MSASYRKISRSIYLAVLFFTKYKMALASASEVMLENFALLPSSSLEDDHFRVTRAAKKKCPPVKVQNGFSPFAFLAFILISINTIMNISNNISNNNNNRNNNNNDNNNNNLFSSNNVNMRRSFDFVPDSGKNDLNFYLFILFCICWNLQSLSWLKLCKVELFLLGVQNCLKLCDEVEKEVKRGF